MLWLPLFAFALLGISFSRTFSNRKVEYLQKSVSLLPQGGSAKNIAMFFYLKEGPGKEPEVGQQEQKHPLELIFGKASRHSI